MKTTKFKVQQQCWINAQLRQKGDFVELTKKQAQELAPPFGNNVIPVKDSKKEPQNGKLDGSGRKNGAPVK